MQRIISLGLLAALLGGGWSYFQGFSASDLKRVAQTVGQVAQQGAQPQATSGGFAPAGSFAPNQPSYTPYGQQVAPQPQVGFGPTPSQTRLPTIRIATFNIQTFGNSKSRKPHVMQALAHVIRLFDVVAIQEIRTKDDYFIPKFLRDYVNQAPGVAYDALVSSRLGRTASKEQYAFIYNTAKIETAPGFSFVTPDPEDRLHREPHVALFRTRIQPVDRAFTFALMNIHTDPDLVKTDGVKEPNELDALYDFYRMVQQTPFGGGYEDDVILLGDLNTGVPARGPHTPNERSRSLLRSDLRLLAKVPGIRPLILDQATNTRGHRLHDNLLIPTNATSEYTGSSGVIDLQSLFRITQDQAKQISDHLPVWGEFSAVESTSLGRVASRP